MAICEEYKYEEDEEDDVVGPVFHRRRSELKSIVSRRSRSWIVAEEEEEEDKDLDPLKKIVESKEIFCSRHNKYKRIISGRNFISPNTQIGPLTLVLTQKGVLNCPICLDLLSTPIFQCENGDILCSSCHSKLLNNVNQKCPFCGMSIDINNCRCYALEKFIDSISKISCKYAYNGCKKWLDYNNKTNHEETCPYVFFLCPYPSCNSGGLSNKVYHHFRTEHAATCFTYDTAFSVSVDMNNENRIFLQEHNQSVVFILNHELQQQGGGVVVFYIQFFGPGSLKHNFIYQLTAETADSSLSLKSVPQMYSKWSSSSPRKIYLTVPSEFADSNGFLSLSICISKRISSTSLQEVGEEFGSEYDLSNGAITAVVILTNPYLLHCSICLHPLFTPYFQYETGNIVCLICCSKVEKKCPKCFPFGYNYNRCRGLEKVTESIKVSCKNAGYGCDEKLPYSLMVSDHEESCGYALCFCPHPSCSFTGIDIYLYLHFGIQHAAVITRFTYDTTFSVSVDINENHVFLQERQNGRGAIFILNHQVQEHGRAFYLDCVSSNTVKTYLMYQLSAKRMEKTVCLKSVPEVLTKWSSHSPPKNYLTVPSDFASYNEPLTLSICISKGIEATTRLLFGDKCS